MGTDEQIQTEKATAVHNTPAQPWLHFCEVIEEGSTDRWSKFPPVGFGGEDFRFLQFVRISNLVLEIKHFRTDGSDHGTRDTRGISLLLIATRAIASSRFIHGVCASC
jgi:hypothetical protein